MRVHCFSVVRDEADVIGHSLDAALRWAHAVHVLDNGSTDGTWELLQDYAAREPRIVLAGRYEGEWNESLWGEVAQGAGEDARDGDWWCRLDADEIYVDDPRDVLGEIPAQFGVVYSASITYLFTDVDLAAYEADPSRYLADWAPDVMRYYQAGWSERRFVRHQPGTPWRGAWPRGIDKLAGAPRRIRLQHYPYRSPPQIERRLEARLALTVAPLEFRHEQSWSEIRSTEELLFPVPRPGDPLWKSRVFRSDACHHDSRDGGYVIDWDALPAVQPGRTHWRPADVTELLLSWWHGAGVTSAARPSAVGLRLRTRWRLFKGRGRRLLSRLRPSR